MPIGTQGAIDPVGVHASHFEPSIPPLERNRSDLSLLEEGIHLAQRLVDEYFVHEAGGIEEKTMTLKLLNNLFFIS